MHAPIMVVKSYWYFYVLLFDEHSSFTPNHGGSTQMGDRFVSGLSWNYRTSHLPWHTVDAHETGLTAEWNNWKYNMWWKWRVWLNVIHFCLNYKVVLIPAGEMTLGSVLWRIMQTNIMQSAQIVHVVRMHLELDLFPCVCKRGFLFFVIVVVCFLS